jgi:hypothetical protein
LIAKALRDAIIKLVEGRKVNDIILPVYFAEGETI